MTSSAQRYLNDLYTLELRGNNSTAWELPATFGVAPPPRESHTGVAYTDKALGKSRLVIYGGMSGCRLGDLWYLECDTMTWSKPVVQGIPPLPRSLHSSTVIGHRMYVFGGWVPLVMDDMKVATHEKEWKCTNTLACLNLENLEKSEEFQDIVFSGNSVVFSFNRSWYIRFALALFGNAQSRELHIVLTLYVLNTFDAVRAHPALVRPYSRTTSLCLSAETTTWEPLNVDLMEDNTPRARAGHCSVGIYTRLYVWSGRDGYRKAWNNQVCCKDLWFLEVDKPPVPGRVQLVRASTHSLEVSWGSAPTAEVYLLQIQRYDTPPATPLASAPPAPAAVKPPVAPIPAPTRFSPAAPQPEVASPPPLPPLTPPTAVMPAAPLTPAGLPLSPRPPSTTVVQVPSIGGRGAGSYVRLQTPTPGIRILNRMPLSAAASGAAPLAPRSTLTGVNPVLPSPTSVTSVSVPGLMASRVSSEQMSGIQTLAAAAATQQMTVASAQPAALKLKSYTKPVSTSVTTVSSQGTPTQAVRLSTPGGTVLKTGPGQAGNKILLQKPGAGTVGQQIVTLVKTSQGMTVAAMPKMSLIAGKPGTPGQLTTIQGTPTKTIPQGATIVKLLNTGAGGAAKVLTTMKNMPSNMMTVSKAPGIGGKQTIVITKPGTMGQQGTVALRTVTSAQATMASGSSPAVALSAGNQITGAGGVKMIFVSSNAMSGTPGQAGKPITITVPGQQGGPPRTVTLSKHSSLLNTSTGHIVGSTQGLLAGQQQALTLGGKPVTMQLATDGGQKTVTLVSSPAGGSKQPDSPLVQRVALLQRHPAPTETVAVSSSTDDSASSLTSSNPRNPTNPETEGNPSNTDSESMSSDPSCNSTLTKSDTFSGELNPATDKPALEGLDGLHMDPGGAGGGDGPAGFHAPTEQKQGVGPAGDYYKQEEEESRVKAEDFTDALATLASAALSCDQVPPLETKPDADFVQDVKPPKVETKPDPKDEPGLESPSKQHLRKEELWFDVGWIKATQCNVSSFYVPLEGGGTPLALPSNAGDLPDYTQMRKVQLEPGVAYKFRVSGINSCGRGPFSEVSAFKTCLPGFPGAPSAIKISKKGETAHLSWEPPSSTSGEILEYSVYLAVKSSNTSPTQSDPKAPLTNTNQLAFVRVYFGPTNQCVVSSTSLAAAHIDRTTKPAIIFRIAARNEKGYGPATQVRWLQEVQASQVRVPVGGVKRAVDTKQQLMTPAAKRTKTEES
uniref:(California timema) hypothetical protein n=1 Tax=Timema californicum TaxID=61474 RepID=A0A7R9J1I0_TIMCA|nr:unnamed protein product [Timema californicum]